MQLPARASDTDMTVRQHSLRYSRASHTGQIDHSEEAYGEIKESAGLSDGEWVKRDGWRRGSGGLGSIVRGIKYAYTSRL